MNRVIVFCCLGFFSISDIFCANIDITTDTPPNIISSSDTYNFTGDFNLFSDSSSNILNTTTTNNDNEGTITLSNTISVSGQIGTSANNIKNLDITSGTVNISSSIYTKTLDISNGVNLTTGTLTLFSPTILNAGSISLNGNTNGNITNNGSLNSYGVITGNISNNNYVALYGGDVFGDIQNNSILSLNNDAEVQGTITGNGSIFVNDNYNSNGTLSASNIYVSKDTTLDLSGGDATISSDAILYGSNAKIESDENLFINNVIVSSTIDEYHDFGIDRANRVVEITSSNNLSVNNITLPSDTALVNFTSNSISDAISSGKIDVSMHYNSAASLFLIGNDERTYNAAGNAIYSEKIVFDELNAMNASQIQKSISTMNPRMEGITTGTINLSNQVLSAVKDYLELARVKANKNFVRKLNDTGSVWTQVFYNKTQKDSNDILSGFSTQSTGVVFGLEKDYKADSINGVALSIAKVDVDSNNQVSSATTTIDSMGLSLYSLKDFGSYYLNGVLSYFINKNSSNRDIEIGTISRNANANYDSSLLAVNIEMGIPLNLYGLSFIPKAGITYSNLNIDSYKEDGASSLNLSVNTENYNQISSNFGFELFDFIYLDNGILIPRISSRYVLNSGDEYASTNSNFQGGGDSFKTIALAFDKNYYTINSGLSYLSNNRLSEFSINYDLTKASGYEEERGVIKANFKF